MTSLGEATIWNIAQLDWKLCIYDDENCTLKRPKTFMARETFFYSVNYCFMNGKLYSFFTTQKLGQQTLPRYIREV